MTLNQKDGILVISYSGYFTVYDAKLFQRELELKIRNINPEEYVLVVDMHDIRLSKQELAPLLDEIKKMYLDAPFRYIFAVDNDGYITKMKRKEVQRENWTIVPTVDDALSRVRRGLCPAKKDAGHTS